MASYDDADGVWRTIGGRRVFIRNGQSLSEAMIQSGKFKNLRSDYKKAKEEVEKLKQDEYESKVYGSDVKKADEEMKKVFGDDFKYAEDREEEIKAKEEEQKENEEPEKKKLMGYRINEETGKRELYEHTEEDNELGHWEKDANGNRVFVKNPRYKEETDREQEIEAKQEAVNKSFEENQRLEIAKDIAKEVYGLNENNATPERIEKEAKRILEYSDGEVLEKGDTPFTNSNGELERSTKSLEQWRNNLKGGKEETSKSSEEIVKLPDGTPIDQNYIKDIYSGMSYDEVKRENDFDKEWLDKVKPEARPMQTAKVKETEKYLANMERYESRIDDKEFGKKDWGEGVYPFSEGTAWKGTKSGQNLSTTEIAKEVTNKMKEAYPGVNISRKTSYYSGGSSADFSIMSSDKPLIRNIDDFSETELNRLYNSGYNSNYYKNVDEFKEALGKRLSSGNIDINKYHIDENYELTPYGKAVIKDLNKVIDAYNYDESDSMTDYFHTGFYSDISIGKYNKPYEVTQKTMNDKVRDKFYTKKDGTKVYDPYKGTPYELKYDSVADALKDPNSNINKYMNDKLQQKAYKKYMKEHPNSKMSLETFKKSRKK